jgi:uncharacterized BrkB/YihY/UPF0761 family membrane protein
MDNNCRNTKRPSNLSVVIRQGQPFVVIVLIVAIIMISFLYVIFDNVLGQVYSRTHSEADVMQDDYQNLYVQLRTIWVWFPMVFIVALIFWSFIESQKRNPND